MSTDRGNLPYMIPHPSSKAFLSLHCPMCSLRSLPRVTWQGKTPSMDADNPIGRKCVLQDTPNKAWEKRNQMYMRPFQWFKTVPKATHPSLSFFLKPDLLVTKCFSGEEHWQCINSCHFRLPKGTYSMPVILNPPSLQPQISYSDDSVIWS